MTLNLDRAASNFIKDFYKNYIKLHSPREAQVSIRKEKMAEFCRLLQAAYDLGFADGGEYGKNQEDTQSGTSAGPGQSKD